MKRLFVIPFLLLFGSPVIADVKTEAKLLCLRSQTAYDLSFRANNEEMYYSMKVWLPAIKEEKKKFEARGEELNDSSVFDEPFKSIQIEHDRLGNISREKRHAYARTLVPILNLAGYERPEFYLWYYTNYHDVIKERHNTTDLRKIEEFQIGQDYYSHTGQGNDTRDEFCKIYGYEFKDRYRDEEFERKYKLKNPWE
tara:strand:- start:78 stop:668 length:591 start_codon:yes stop_codon:yes gene_type:complete